MDVGCHVGQRGDVNDARLFKRRSAECCHGDRHIAERFLTPPCRYDHFFELPVGATVLRLNFGRRGHQAERSQGKRKRAGTAN